MCQGNASVQCSWIKETVSRFTKKLKKAAGWAVSPVMAGTKKLTGLSYGKQLGIGAVVGGGVMAAGAMGAGATGYASTGLGSGATAVGTDAAAGGLMGGFNPWSLAAPVIGAGADIYSAGQIARGQREANQMSLASAREQMAFQEMMSSTSHQREVADLKAAGINPVLSANSGAPMGSGASINAVNEAPDYRGIVGKGIDSAVNVKRLQKELSLADSQISLNLAAKMREQKSAEAQSANAADAREMAAIHRAQSEMEQRDNEYWKRNPKAFELKKALDIIKPAISSAGEAVGMYRDIQIGKGMGKFKQEGLGKPRVKDKEFFGSYHRLHPE